ncbi:MAG: sugar phosphate isomerase/epimerase family protein [Planctomycetaceae bacterium]
MKLGYNTNGLPHHRWDDALDLIAETGYTSVALTVDHHCLNPFAPDWRDEADRVRRALNDRKLGCVIETGARFLLNPRVKHEPTLVSPDADERSVRVGFLKHCVDIAELLDADAVSFWSGILRDDVPRTTAMKRLATGCREVAGYAAARGIRLAFEPEPGMFVERFADFAELRDRVAAPRFGLTIDVGHVHCLDDGIIADRLREWGHLLFNVHVEDMRRGVHEHLPFGEGEIDFPPALAALREIGYTGGVHVELSRLGHAAPQLLRESFQFLTEILRDMS